MRHLFLVSLVILISTSTASCGPGELFGPKFTSTPTTTLTLTSTSTSTITPTPTITLTPTPTPTPIGGGSGMILVVQETDGEIVTLSEGSKYPYPSSILRLMDLNDPPGKVLISKEQLEDILNKHLISTFFDPSPDGSKTLIYACTSFERSGCSSEVYIASLDLSSLVPIKVDAAKYMNWVWSPDSTKVLGQVFFETGNSIYVVKSDGSELRKLGGSIYYNGDPFWSFDGLKIYWFQNGGLTVTNVDGSNNHRVVDVDFYSRSLQFSPDGQKVAFFFG